MNVVVFFLVFVVLVVCFVLVAVVLFVFVVLLIGVCFGWKLGGAIVTIYLLEGIVGLPVFSGTPEKGSGIIYFTGPTMGYLIGFVLASMLCGIFKFDKNIIMSFLKLVLSVSIIYILGVIWLGTLIGWDKPIIQLGVTPFLFAELFKIGLLLMIITVFNSKLDSLKKWM